MVFQVKMLEAELQEVLERWWDSSRSLSPSATSMSGSLGYLFLFNGSVPSWKCSSNSVSLASASGCEWTSNSFIPAHSSPKDRECQREFSRFPALFLSRHLIRPTTVQYTPFTVSSLVYQRTRGNVDIKFACERQKKNIFCAQVISKF